MKDNYASSFAVVQMHEGGSAFTDDPNDPGGATKYGVTQGTYDDYRFHKDLPKQTVANATQEEAAEISKTGYWDQMLCDELPSGVDLSLMDMGYNAGPSRAIKILQEILRLPADGIVGPETIGAAHAVKDPGMLCTTYAVGRMDYYEQLSTWPTYGKGWSRRTYETEDISIAMTGDLEPLEVLYQGLIGTQVAYLQSLLGETADGVFGSATKMAVEAAQKFVGLARTGICDRETWAALHEHV